MLQTSALNTPTTMQPVLNRHGFAPLSRRLCINLLGPPLWRCLTLVGLGVAFLQPPAQATTLLRLDLNALCERAGQIFRGQVVGIEPGTVEAGGGRLPTVTYRIKVSETLRGALPDVVELRMIGNLKEE